jgi:hypothetical protein
MVNAWFYMIGPAALACPERSDRTDVSDDVVPPSYGSAVSESGHSGRFHPDAAASHAIPRLAPGVGLIVVLFLSIGLWGAVWLVVSALGSV